MRYKIIVVNDQNRIDMSRTRIVKGSYTKISAKGHNMYSQENISTTASKLVTEEGTKKGLSLGMPKPPPKSPIVYDNYPSLKGEMIFCNGFHSAPFGAINAALNITIGTEDRPWYLPDGENTHHKRGESGDGENEAPLTPSDMDEDIMSSEEVIKAESRPEKEIGIGIGTYPILLKPKIKDSDAYIELSKFKGYWNVDTNKNQAVDLYTTFFNSEKRDHYINGSHGMGSPAWERECHGITLGYFWAEKNWDIRHKSDVEDAKNKNNPNADSYSPSYRPLTFVGHSEGAAVAVGACLGAMYYAAELGWDEMAVNLILLGIHQPVALWSDEPYDEQRKQVGNYMTDYNTYKWFKKEVLETSDNSPRLINELLANVRKVENAITPYGPALAHIFTEDRNKQKYGIDEWTAKLIGTDNWNQLKKRAVQFTFANDRADTVMLDGDIPGIANAKGEDDCTLFGWQEWTTHSAGLGGITQNSDLTMEITNYGKGHMNTRIKVNKENPDLVAYQKTTYQSWADEFFSYHKKFKTAAVVYEKKYKEKWETGHVYMNQDVILTNTNKAFDYAKVADSHKEMMEKYVWMHHVELEAHFAPVGYFNRPEIFNLPDGKTRDPNWPESEGKTIWERIMKTSENNGDLFYRVPYLETKEYHEDIEKYIIPEIKKKKKDIKYLRTKEKDYVENLGKKNLIDPTFANNPEIEKWVTIAKKVIEEQHRSNQKLQQMMQDNMKEFKKEMDEYYKEQDEKRKRDDVEWGD